MGGSDQSKQIGNLLKGMKVENKFMIAYLYL